MAGTLDRRPTIPVTGHGSRSSAHTIRKAISIRPWTEHREGRSERAGRINGPTGDVKSRRRYVTRAQRLHGSLRMWNGSVIQFVSKKNSNHRSGRRGLYTLHLCRGPRQTRNVYSLARSGCARFLIQICRTHLYNIKIILIKII